jgi:hypothetical protein
MEALVYISGIYLWRSWQTIAHLLHTESHLASCSQVTKLAQTSRIPQVVRELATEVAFEIVQLAPALEVRQHYSVTWAALFRCCLVLVLFLKKQADQCKSWASPSQKMLSIPPLCAVRGHPVMPWMLLRLAQLALQLHLEFVTEWPLQFLHLSPEGPTSSSVFH